MSRSSPKRPAVQSPMRPPQLTPSNQSPTVRSKLTKLEESNLRASLAKLGDSNLRSDAMRSLNDYVAQLDPDSIPRFLTEVAKSREDRSNRFHAVSLYEVCARVHGPLILPVIPRIVTTLLRSMSYDHSSSQSLQQACTKVIVEMVRQISDDRAVMEEVLGSICKPLIEAMENPVKATADAGVLCLQALVESEKWECAAVETEGNLSRCLTNVLMGPNRQPGHIHLACVLAKASPGIVGLHAAELSRVAMEIVEKSDAPWQLRAASAKLLRTILPLGGDLSLALKTLEAVKFDKAVQVRSEVTESLRALKLQSSSMPTSCSASMGTPSPTRSRSHITPPRTPPTRRSSSTISPGVNRSTDFASQTEFRERMSIGGYTRSNPTTPRRHSLLSPYRQSLVHEGAGILASPQGGENGLRRSDPSLGRSPMSAKRRLWSSSLKEGLPQMSNSIMDRSHTMPAKRPLRDDRQNIPTSDWGGSHITPRTPSSRPGPSVELATHQSSTTDESNQGTERGRRGEQHPSPDSHTDLLSLEQDTSLTEDLELSLTSMGPSLPCTRQHPSNAVTPLQIPTLNDPELNEAFLNEESYTVNLGPEVSETITALCDLGDEGKDLMADDMSSPMPACTGSPSDSQSKHVISQSPLKSSSDLSMTPRKRETIMSGMRTVVAPLPAYVNSVAADTESWGRGGMQGTAISLSPLTGEGCTDSPPNLASPFVGSKFEKKEKDWESTNWGGVVGEEEGGSSCNKTNLSRGAPTVRLPDMFLGNMDLGSAVGMRRRSSSLTPLHSDFSSGASPRKLLRDLQSLSPRTFSAPSRSDNHGFRPLAELAGAPQWGQLPPSDPDPVRERRWSISGNPVYIPNEEEKNSPPSFGDENENSSAVVPKSVKDASLPRYVVERQKGTAILFRTRKSSVVRRITRNDSGSRHKGAKDSDTHKCVSCDSKASGHSNGTTENRRIKTGLDDIALVHMPSIETQPLEDKDEGNGTDDDVEDESCPSKPWWSKIMGFANESARVSAVAAEFALGGCLCAIVCIMIAIPVSRMFYPQRVTPPT